MIVYLRFSFLVIYNIVKLEFGGGYILIITYENVQYDDFASDIIINNSSNVCVIILHGFNATPYEMHDLAEAIGKLPVDVYVPLLPKHGISSEELAGLKLDEVIEWSKNLILEKKMQYEKVIIIGHSMGSGMVYSIISSGINVDGAVMSGLSRNMTYRIRFITWIAKILNLKFIPGIFGKLENSKSISKYYLKWKKEKIPKQPIKLMREVVETVPNRFSTIKQIESPFMLIIGTEDFITHADYVDNFLAETRSKRRIAFVLNDGTHEVFLSDFKNKAISKILNFIVEIISEKSINEKEIECYLLDGDEEIDKTQNLLNLIKSKKSIKSSHSEACLN